MFYTIDVTRLHNDEVALMIKRFSVRGFKGFHGLCTVDFSKTRDYDFNKHLLKNGLVNKALLYGKNGSGKSNLGFAMMDIATHMTDNQRSPVNYLYSLNGDSAEEKIYFEYVFQFGSDEVTYEYEKDGTMALLYERVLVNSQSVFFYNYESNKMEIGLKEISSLNKQVLLNRNIANSALKTIYGYSAHLPSRSPVKQIYEFANGMLWFRSLGGYEFMGTTNAIDNVEQYLASSPIIIQSFETFLRSCGLEYCLKAVSDVNGKRLYAEFANHSYPFFSIASTGTKSLCLYFYWMDKYKDRLTFLYLDEFDAFYHFNLAQAIMANVNSNASYQSIITTHNPYLADNSFMRPDCYLNMKDGKVQSFADSTNRVIRQGNSLEKMVLADDL